MIMDMTDNGIGIYGTPAELRLERSGAERCRRLLSALGEMKTEFLRRTPPERGADEWTLHLKGGLGECTVETSLSGGSRFDTVMFPPRPSWYELYMEYSGIRDLLVSSCGFPVHEVTEYGGAGKDRLRSVFLCDCAFSCTFLAEGRRLRLWMRFCGRSLGCCVVLTCESAAAEACRCENAA